MARKVAIYARVSTEHEAQISALAPSRSACQLLRKGALWAKPGTLHGLPRPLQQGEAALRSNDGEAVRRNDSRKDDML